VWAVSAMVVCAAGSVVVGTVLLTGAPPTAAHHRYNVTFMAQNDSLTGTSGSAPLRTTTDVSVKVAGKNITAVNFTVTWQDQSISPLFDPAVTASIAGPNGTGSTTGRVASRGTSLTVALPTSVPANTTVEASSEQQAIEMAGGSDLNATLGTGDWTVSLQVGGPIGPRPGGSIAYAIAVQVEYYIGTAKPL
jgi:hypothetical protein